MTARCARCRETRATHYAGPTTVPRVTGEPGPVPILCPAFVQRAPLRVRWATRVLRALS